MRIGEYSGYNFPADIDSYASEAGATPDVVEWFQSWSEPLFYGSQEAGVDARGVTPLITWSPGASFSMLSLLNGQYDDYLAAQAQLARSWNRQLLVRPFHEMNGSWSSYGYGTDTPATFIAGWRYLVSFFRSHGVTNISWVWSPNIYGFGSTAPFDAYYPGDDYVDWVGLDGYNFPGQWRSFAALFTSAYNDITNLTSKPLMVAEWGCSSTGGDKAQWILDAFTVVAAYMPRVLLMTVFDHVAESDFRIDSSPDVASAYRLAVATYGSG